MRDQSLIRSSESMPSHPNGKWSKAAPFNVVNVKLPTKTWRFFNQLAFPMERPCVCSYHEEECFKPFSLPRAKTCSGAGDVEARTTVASMSYRRQCSWHKKDTIQSKSRVKEVCRQRLWLRDSRCSCLTISIFSTYRRGTACMPVGGL